MPSHGEKHCSHVAFFDRVVCSCHYDLLQQTDTQLPAEVRELCLKCPMRGRRCPELASGAVLEILQQLWLGESKSIVAEMPPELSEEDAFIIVQDFERGRHHLVAEFTLKMAHWTQPLYSGFAVAHSDGEKAVPSGKEQRSSHDTATTKKMLLRLCIMQVSLLDHSP